MFLLTCTRTVTRLMSSVGQSVPSEINFRSCVFSVTILCPCTLDSQLTPVCPTDIISCVHYCSQSLLRIFFL